jgi:hypothetical protein
MSFKLTTNFGKFPKYNGNPMESSNGDFSSKILGESTIWDSNQEISNGV